MSQSLAESLVALVDTQIKSGDVDALSGATLHYYVSGGAPGQMLRKTITLIGDGHFSVSISDQLNHEPNGEGSAQLDAVEVQHLFNLLTSDFADYVTDSPSTFLPDTLIGSLKLIVGEQNVTIIFNGSEKARQRVNTVLSPSLEQLIRQLDDIAHGLLSPDRDTQSL